MQEHTMRHNQQSVSSSLLWTNYNTSIYADAQTQIETIKILFPAHCFRLITMVSYYQALLDSLKSIFCFWSALKQTYWHSTKQSLWLGKQNHYKKLSIKMTNEFMIPKMKQIYIIPPHQIDSTCKKGKKSTKVWNSEP